MKTVYLAYPIDQSKGGGWLAMVEDLKWRLTTGGPFGAVYDPGDAFKIGNLEAHGRDNSTIAAVNALALDRSDTIVAFLPKETATVGVPMEIDRAVAAGKLVIIFTDVEVSFMLNYDRPNVHVYGFQQIPWVVQAMSTLWEEHEESMIDRGQDRVALFFKREDSDAVMPTRAYPDDAGIDLYTVGEWTIEPGAWVDIPTGLRVELPPYLWGNLVGRSSTWRNLRLNVIQGVIDPGYRGPLFAAVHNPTDLAVRVAHGTRLAQLILMGNATREFEIVEAQTLSESDRGVQGFGSSGSGL